MKVRKKSGKSCRDFPSLYTYRMLQPTVLQEKRDITHLSGYRTSTTARYYYEIFREEDLNHLLEFSRFSRESNLPILIISRGTNLLFVENEYPGIVIKNSLSGWKYDEDTKILQTFANESLWNIADTLEKEYNNSLWHRFIWLPGSVGGAVYGNAGCFGLETESNFLKATVYDMKEGVRKYFDKSDMEFGYRHSMLKLHPEYILISAVFDLSKKVEKYHSDVDNIDFRENKQPKGYSCGSFFKNPSKEQSAWWLIESVWLKWYHHGWAFWSDIHANFLMSDGKTCTGKDLYELVQLTEKKVYEKHWIQLVNEVKIIM